MVKSCYCSCRGPRFNSQHPPGGSQCTHSQQTARDGQVVDSLPSQSTVPVNTPPLTRLSPRWFHILSDRQLRLTIPRGMIRKNLGTAQRERSKCWELLNKIEEYIVNMRLLLFSGLSNMGKGFHIGPLCPSFSTASAVTAPSPFTVRGNMNPGLLHGFQQQYRPQTST